MLDYKLIGKRLQKVRLLKKTTQHKLASMLGVCDTYISRVERGKLPISLKRLSQICEILGITEGNILDRKEE